MDYEDCKDSVYEAIEATAPSDYDQIRPAWFAFCRILLGIRPREWWEANDRRRIREAHAAWCQRVRSCGIEAGDNELTVLLKGVWDSVRWGVGAGPVEACFAPGGRDEPTVAQQYDGVQRRLVVACYRLSKLNKGSFFLSCRTAGHCLDISFGRANVLLRLLQDDGVIRAAEGMDGKRRKFQKAKRYCWIGDATSD